MVLDVKIRLGHNAENPATEQEHYISLGLQVMHARRPQDNEP